MATQFWRCSNDDGAPDLAGRPDSARYCGRQISQVAAQMKRIRITDKSQRINLANYESKARKLIVVLELAAQTLRDGLAEIEKDKKA
jgi:hypothetical protein